MPNYFFSIRTGDNVTNIVNGSPQADLSAARQCAETTAREYLAQQIEAQALPCDGIFEIRDAQNSLVATFPVQSVMNMHLSSTAMTGLEPATPMTKSKPGDEFAVSSNGDRWFLLRDQAMQPPYVLHRANQPAGGTETRYDVEDFLKMFPGSPEHAALINLITATEPIAMNSNHDLARLFLGTGS